MRAISAPVRVSALGMYVPENILTNADLEKIVETNDEWIVQRTGIRRRHVVAPDQYSSDLCRGAIQDLLAQNPGLEIERVDYVIVASTTPDYAYPSLAALMQNEFGIRSAGAMDISTACAGFAYGLNVGAGLIASEQAASVLVVAGDALTRSADYTDRSTCVLFGDGAAAALLERAGEPALFGMTAGSDGDAGRFLYRTGIRSEIYGVDDPAGLLRQNGREVYRWVMENMPGAVQSVLDRAGFTAEQIDWFVPHSANLRMIEALAKRVGFSMEKTLTSIEEYGNTSAVSIPLAVIPAIRDGRVKKGDRLLLVGFGGGLVWAGNVLQWTG